MRPSKRMRSVVLASYDGSEFIDAQLDSIVAQLNGDDEIIVSDDSSADDTVDRILRRKDSRIRVFDHANRVGYVKNFERAISYARGHHIFLSDQDDVWLPRKVEQISAALDTWPCVASDAIVVDRQLEEMHPSFFALRGTKRFSTPTIFLKPCIIGATLACQRSYLDGLLPFPRGIPHDFWISLNAAWDSSLEILMEPLILYRRHPASASVSATSRKRGFLTISRERAAIASVMIARRLGRTERG